MLTLDDLYPHFIYYNIIKYPRTLSIKKLIKDHEEGGQPQLQDKLDNFFIVIVKKKVLHPHLDTIVNQYLNNEKYKISEISMYFQKLFFFKVNILKKGVY